MTDDRGAGSVLAVGLIAAITCLAAILLPLGAALGARQSVNGAADAAALAAADVASGVVPGYPCDSAARVAAANHATLDSCELDGLVATVSVSTVVIGIQVVAIATAGPPPD